MLLLNELPTKKPIVFEVPTMLNVDEGEESTIDHMHFEIVSEKKNKIEQMILTAAWHGTGGTINPQIVEYIQQNYANEIDNKDTKELSSYYFEPSNADLHFEILMRRMLEETLADFGMTAK